MRVLSKIFLLCLVGSAYAETEYQTVIESSTPAIISNLQVKAKHDNVAKGSVGQINQWLALQLLDKPYSIALLDRQMPEYMYVTLGATDCMLFVEEVLASSELIKQQQFNLNNLTKETKNLRYHGTLSYCNRNHYFKDWAITNISKGYVTDAAYQISGITFPFEADVMSKKIAESSGDIHRSDFACIQEREQAINEGHLGFIPLRDLPKYLKDIKPGDIIGIVRTPGGRADAVHHLGIAYVHNNLVSMIHASSKSGKVVIANTLMEYLNQYKDSQGIILLRPQLMHNE